VAQKRKKAFKITVFFIFIFYFFVAARPIPRETVLAPMWISSLQAGGPESSLSGVSVSGTENKGDKPLPFTLGINFGYVDNTGHFVVNRTKTAGIYLSENFWTEYDAEPSNIEIMNIKSDTVAAIENPGGYPVLLDNRVFILGSDQNSLSEIGMDGSTLWTYEFGAPLTCIDAAAGLVLTGSIDGIIEILDAGGKRIFYFEPGGSRYTVILGCAISGDGSRLGIICGIDQQRFLMFERYGNSGSDYKVVYHEFLEYGFRRPVRILFIDDDQRIVYERYEGLGCYNIKSRQGISIPVEGEIAAVDGSGNNGYFFLIRSRSPQRKELIGIKFPQESWLPFLGYTRNAQDMIFLRASFKSDDVFLGRAGSMLIAGGGTTLISFDLEEK
jgi:hypothetical protein